MSHSAKGWKGNYPLKSLQKERQLLVETVVLSGNLLYQDVLAQDMRPDIGHWDIHFPGVSWSFCAHS